MGPLYRVAKIAFVDDVVSVEHTARTMPGDLHGNSLGNAGTDHVADRRASQVVEDEPSSVQARKSGDVTIERTIYRPQGGGKSIAPLEVQAGLVEGCWTPLLARVMARTVAGTTPKEAAELFGEFGGARPSSSSLDRLPKKLSQIWELARPVFEKELREEEEIPAAATSVAVSLDGVQVPMQDGERTKKRAQSDRRSTGPAGYREVGCGTVSFFDSGGERLSTVRYARMPRCRRSRVQDPGDGANEALRHELAGTRRTGNPDPSKLDPEQPIRSRLAAPREFLHGARRETQQRRVTIRIRRAPFRNEDRLARICRQQLRKSIEDSAAAVELPDPALATVWAALLDPFPVGTVTAHDLEPS